jgi:glycosyltransferase involved in cell wall biosynthesis
MPDTFIVVITKNRRELLKQCISSLIKSYIGDAHLTVVDNGSSDGTVNYLRSVKRVDRVIANPANVPQWQKSYAIRQAHKLFMDTEMSYFSWVDDDMVLKPDWLKAGKRILAECPNAVAAALHTDKLQERKHPTISTLDVGPYKVRLKRTSNGPCWVVRRDFASLYGLPPVTGRVDHNSMSDRYYEKLFRKKKLLVGVADMSTHIGYKDSLRMVLQGKRKPKKLVARRA